MFNGRNTSPELDCMITLPLLSSALGRSPKRSDRLPCRDANLFRYCRRSGEWYRSIRRKRTITRFGDNGYNFGMNICFNGGMGLQSEFC